MVIIGNILLAVAGLVFLLIAFETLGKSVPGGDAAVGFAWAILISNIVLFICCAAVAWIIGLRGGWAWVGSSGGSRFLWVAGGLFAAVCGAAFGGFREGSGFLTTVGAVFSAIIPPLLLVGLGILLNGGSTRWPLFGAAGLGLLFSSPLLFRFVSQPFRNASARLEYLTTRDKEYRNSQIDNIDSVDVTKDLVFLLVYTDKNQDRDVRERALAKMKTHPDYQKELIRLVTCDWAPETFHFFSSNDPDDPARLAEPVRDGIFRSADLARKRIRESQDYHFFKGDFKPEVRRILATVERFKKNSSVDYRPAVQAFRDALEDSHGREKRLEAIENLDEWLKKN